LDISVSFPLCLLLKKIPVLLHRPSWPCASWPVSTGISFDYYHHRCQDFCSFMVFAWHWKKDSALSLGLVHRTSPLRRGPGWWPLGVAWLVMLFLRR
jgi:hypothetical protein